MLKLLALFVLVPAVELVLLIDVGSRIGTFATLALIVATGMLGAALARWQGLGVLATIRAEIDRGQMPTRAILDGVIILIAAAVLMTPGLITDAFGFLCLVPLTRRLITRSLWKRVEGVLRDGGANVYVHTNGPASRPRPDQPDIDVTPVRTEDRDRSSQPGALGPRED